MKKGPQANNSGFDREFSYDGKLARWWIRRSGDYAHRHAYTNIANFIRASFPRSPRLIVDYACGAGHMLSRLSLRFPDSRLAGLDGSSLLLELAKRRISRLPSDCSRRISLHETSLPKVRLLQGCAELVIFCFPNMMPSPSQAGIRAEMYPVSDADRRIAGSLSLSKDPCGGERRLPDPWTVQIALEQGRCVSRNLRRLLVRGGICVRVEYATMQRHEWSALELQRVSFEEGTLDMKVAGVNPRRWFRILASAYFRSGVMEDVYQQTRQPRDRKGGYLITVLRAL